MPPERPLSLERSDSPRIRRPALKFSKLPSLFVGPAGSVPPVAPVLARFGYPARLELAWPQRGATPGYLLEPSTPRSGDGVNDDTDIGRNGYRSAKPQGKPTFTIGHFSLCRRYFCDCVFDGAKCAFTPRSSRTLNCPSNLFSHDHPNNRPKNGTRMIRQSVSGLAIRSCALLNKGCAIGRKTGFHFC
ncbi:hypothetical protein [Bradyrhizobium sp. AZCC 1721]|uniref:hypothetical protein n=1 Tax=Bradyrhizobium sp. AZCC 1721 TaxID=3117016 RepID=UPI002FF30AFB